MSSKDYQNDLPVLVGNEDLPILVTDAAPQQEQTSDKAFIQWSNLASQRHVRNLAFDQQGDLWLATGGGVLHWKLQANRFVRYYSEHGLPGNSVYAIAVDGKNQLWVGHEHLGIYYLKNDIWRHYSDLGEIKVSCLTIDSTGKLWAGTSNGIYAIDSPEQKPTIELPPAGFPPRAMAVVNENDIWLCNAQGIYYYKNSNWIRTSDSVQPDILTLARQGNNLWLGTFRGLVRIDLTTNTSHPINTAPNNQVTALAPHPQGVWAACGEKIGLATEKEWKLLGEKRNTTITSLASPRDEEVWIGSHDGLFLCENKQIQSYLTDTPPDVIRSAPFTNLVQALSVQNLPDRSILWIGTPRGLFSYDLIIENWRRYGQFATEDIRAIVTSQNQTIWVATWLNGLYSSQQKAEFEKAPNITEPINAITTEYNSQYAVGLDGVYHYINKAWVKIISTTELPIKGWLQSVASFENNLWLGTGAGLLQYKSDTRQINTVNGYLGSADIRTLTVIYLQDIEQLCIGTNRGLYIGELEKEQPIQNLENRTITALTWDAIHKTLWVGTDKGLFHFVYQQNNWNTNEFNIYNSGLGASRVTALATSTHNTKTKLWIGTPNGLSCYTY